MSFVVGIDLGTTFTGLAVARRAGSGAMVTLGRRRHVMPTVVWLGDGADDVAIGDAAVRRMATDPANVVSLFKRDVGSEAPLHVGGRDVTVDTLIGFVLSHVLTAAESEHGGTAERVALTFPASWGPLRQGVLVAGADAAGIEEPLLVTEPEAAAAFYASERDVPDQALVAVFDFGGGTLDIAVVHHVSGGFELLGTPIGDDELGGSNIDELLFEHVLDQLDPVIRSEVESDLAAHAALFWACVDAKETLSFDPDADVTCVTASGRRLVRVTRDELDGLIAPLVDRSLAVLREGLEAANVDEAELHSVLLVGGTSRIPLVARRLDDALSCKIAVDTDPKTSVALGAAALALSEARIAEAGGSQHDTVDLGIAGLGPATLVGRGGYSVVYRARQEALDRSVAVKLITGTGFDLTARRRFEQECQAIGRLSEHPNIVNVYQSGAPDGRPAFLVMSFVPDGSCQDELDAGRQLDWRRIVDIGGKLAGALEEAHRAKIFHCDVKPANVLLSPHGEPLLADFGLARVAERTGTQSITGLAGTPHFSPPEVFDGAAPAPERDVYGLAATLHALVSGRPPIDIESESILALMRHVATDEPADLREHDVPGAVADVIARGLAKQPEDRYPSAAEFGAALTAAGAEAERAQTRPASQIDGDESDATGRGTGRRRVDPRVLLGVAGAVLAVLVISVLVVTSGGSDAGEPTSDPGAVEPVVTAAAPPPTEAASDTTVTSTPPPLGDRYEPIRTITTNGLPLAAVVVDDEILVASFNSINLERFERSSGTAGPPIVLPDDNRVAIRGNSIVATAEDIYVSLHEKGRLARVSRSDLAMSGTDTVDSSGLMALPIELQEPPSPEAPMKIKPLDLEVVDDVIWVSAKRVQLSFDDTGGETSIGGALLAVRNDSVERIIELPMEVGAMELVGDDLWFVNYADGFLGRLLDVRANTPDPSIETFDLSELLVSEQDELGDLHLVGDDLWVTARDAGEIGIVALDGELIGSVGLEEGASPQKMLLAFDSVWVTTLGTPLGTADGAGEKSPGAVVRIDPDLRTIEQTIGVGYAPIDLFNDNEFVYIVNHHGPFETDVPREQYALDPVRARAEDEQEEYAEPASISVIGRT